MNTPHEVLKEVFGYEDFRLHQEDIINAVLEGRDCLAVLSTSAGKSLTYQIPAIIMEGTALVVSPLIALMQDQAEEMNSRGIPARFYNSSLKVAEKKKVLEELKSGEIKLLFMAPESLKGVDIYSMVPKVSFFAVDESHCVSSEGFDFRPSYRNILPFIGKRSVPMLALTATANKFVRDDIVSNLELSNNLKLVVGNPDRPEITIRVVEAGKKEKWVKTNLVHVCQKALESGSAMVYIQNRKKCDEFGDILKDRLPSGTPLAVSHAGLSAEERTNALNTFITNENSVSVSTSALGMGVNKRNIRTMIIVGTPKTCVELLQMYGRCARDGKPSTVIIVVDPKADRGKNEYFLKMSKAEYTYKNKIRQEYQKVANMLTPMRRSEDIRKELVEYFK